MDSECGSLFQNNESVLTLFLNNRMKSPVLPFTSNFFSDLAEQFDYSVGTGRDLNTYTK